MSKHLTTHEPRHLRSNNDRQREQSRLREHNGEESLSNRGETRSDPLYTQVVVTRVKIKKGNGKENDHTSDRPLSHV